MLSASNVSPPEMDIFENVADGYITGGTVLPGSKNAFFTYQPGLQDEYHRFGLKWTADRITWYVDDLAVGSEPTPATLHQPMCTLVDLAIGGNGAGSPDRGLRPRRWI